MKTIQGKVLNVFPVFCYPHMKTVVIESENSPTGLMCYTLPKTNLVKGLRQGNLVMITDIKGKITIDKKGR